jgi:sugar phosphate isomerase/epimerase
MRYHRSQMELSRRSLLSIAAAAPFALAQKKIPVGLELYSVRNELQRDQTGTLRVVAEMGYEIVEFFAPYYAWTIDQTREVRKLLDLLGVKCFSTHNDAKNFLPENLLRTAELNHILGSKYVIMASAGNTGWKAVAETLDRAADAWKSAGIRPGYHNHRVEFVAGDGGRPMDLLAANTSHDVVLQFDVGTCVEAGSDPVAWINANPGRIRSMHCKDWAPGPDKGYRVLFGDGVVPWNRVFDAAERTGGIECYLIEQEGSALPAIETAERCLANFRRLHA